ncbi:MAG: pyridoxamine 5'-phosphate oxidase family protein [Clostridium sp.]|uniref:pyridoxamine 5'-phosphate oxidase family protein n=1 Tax=Clostridium sp. TaxID=1506 RepID=UPI00291043DE|nr:pyridoxamine 5'-phosphate oxidase family protein [Clostridium sp.]MDU7338086.1 pyridoxamine 5'-phosphate oxidase family protein [Clostridium sp.]
MRSMRKKDRQTTEEEAYQILEAGEYATLCTVNAEDGTPYGVPISFVVKDHSIYIHMAVAGQKLENLKKDPRVCIMCVGQTLLYPEQYSTDFESTIVTGSAEFIIDRTEKLEALKMLCDKYGMPEGGEFLEKKMQGGVDRMEVVKIPIESITGKARWRKPKPPLE